MPSFYKTLANRSGQMMLLAILLGVMLLITGGLVVFVNQIGTFHQTSSAQRSAARSVAQEGIDHAINELSASQTIWRNALNGDFSSTDCNSDSDLLSPSGGHYKLSCSVDVWNPNLQVYEVAVKSVAMGPADANGVEIPLRAIEAYLSQRTVGVDLSGGVHAGAAIQTATHPNISGTLNVHWGPIVCLESTLNTAWSLLTPLDDQRYPRKFSQEGITGTVYPRSGSTQGAGPNSDQKEYWAYAAQTIPPFIDETSYQALASSTDITTPPISKNSGVNRYPVNNINCGGSHPNCGYFQPDSGDTAIFDANYAVPAGAVIYVAGNAEFDAIAMDSVTFIVTGTLTINPFTSTTAPIPLHVPVTANLEYPYAASPPTWPCSGKAGDTTGGLPAYDCGSDSVFTANAGSVQFRGFLFVKGEFRVMANSNWNMVGTLLVGDMQAPANIQVDNGASLNVAYDDVVNHDIRVLPTNGTAIKIVPDLIQDVPAS